MENLFSIGEISKHLNISKQTLIFYDKIGLFSPVYVDAGNGYRYYSIHQFNHLETILIMRKIGFSLNEIKEHLKSYNIDSSLAAFRKQIDVFDQQIRELTMVKSRIEHRCVQMEHARSVRDGGDAVFMEDTERQFVLCQKVDPPYSLEKICISTKQCFCRSFAEQLPIFYQSGVIVPYKRILEGRYTEASHAFLPIEKVDDNSDVTELPAGRCVCTYHIGDYLSIGPSYERLLQYCKENDLHIVSDSYEFCINDYLSARDESEYITKIMFYLGP